MTTEDHNKTLVMLHSAIGAFFTLGLIGAPWIIAKNFSRPDKTLFAVVIFGIVFLMALLFYATAIAMYRRKPFARKLALIAAVVSFPMGGYVSVYTWWFMHSDGAKQMYGVKGE